MPREPPRGKIDHLVKCVSLFEKMARTGNNHELALGMKMQKWFAWSMMP